jgi:F-type H+-transporting ATPase subunit delta
MAKQVKDVYGNALFELAQEENQIDEYLDEVGACALAMTENPDLISMMTHPQISEEEKEKVLEDIFKGRVKDELYGLMRMILLKGHFTDILDVFGHFESLVKDYRNIGVVFVTTPKPLSDKQKKSVEDRLLETTDYVKLEMNYKEDESLIGGMVIRIGDRIVDSSIRTKLDRLTHELSVGR